jgi:hypothetical protein
MRWHMFGVLVIHAFPKGTEHFVYTYDRSITLNELAVMCESY